MKKNEKMLYKLSVLVTPSPLPNLSSMDSTWKSKTAQQHKPSADAIKSYFTFWC